MFLGEYFLNLKFWACDSNFIHAFHINGVQLSYCPYQYLFFLLYCRVLEEDLVLVVVLEHQLAQMMLKCNAFLLQLMQFWMLLDSIVFPLHQMLFDPSDILFNIQLFMQ
jgi:hypothetical protein